MTSIAQTVVKNAQELTTLLEAVKTKMEAVTKLYPLLGQAEKDSVEYSELKRLINLCEGTYTGDVYYMTDRVKYLTKERTEGKLVLGSDGKYRLDTDEFHVFSCSSPIEVFINNPSPGNYDRGWQFGRVEHRESMGGYYFRSYTCDDHQLYPGMRVAVRD